MASVDSGAAIFGRIVEGDNGDVPPDVARYILDMNFCDNDLARVNQLSAKARAGTLSDSEQQELDNYLQIGDLLAIWHSKARKSLEHSPADS